MTTQPRKPTRRALDPALIRDVLAGFGRRRMPSLEGLPNQTTFDGSAVPMPRSNNPPEADAVTSTDLPSLDALIADLLEGVPAPRPLVRVLAKRVAQMMMRAQCYDNVLAHVPNTADAATWFDMQERVTRLRDMEDAAVQRSLLILDALRSRRIPPTATAIGRRHERNRRACLVNED